MEFPCKIKKGTVFDLAIQLGYLSKENENNNPKKYMHPMFSIALFTIAKIWIQVSTNGLMIKKMQYIHIYIYTHTYTHTHTNRILFSHKKECCIATCDNMDDP